MRLLIRGAQQVVQVASKGELVKRGDEMKDIAILQAPRDQGLSIAINR